MVRSRGHGRCRGGRACAAAAGLWLVACIPAESAPRLTDPGPVLRVAVYDQQPYGGLTPDGAFTGASVDLWRRVAEQRGWSYRLIDVPQMEQVLDGLEKGRFDVAVGAITITPERQARVDFSYPAHQSGVAVAYLKKTGVFSALGSYVGVLVELGPLIALIIAFLMAMGLMMWIVERSAEKRAAGSSIGSFHDGFYWAVVTMTTVGYGDVTPKTVFGRTIAVAWMFGSVVLISILSTTLVSRLTEERMEGDRGIVAESLQGRRLAAVSNSSGAEYLDRQHLPHASFPTLPEALTSLADGRSDAVVNSVGSLQYLIRVQFSAKVSSPRGLLAPAYMAFALPPASPLKKALDGALMTVTASPEWRSVEASYFGR